MVSEKKLKDRHSGIFEISGITACPGVHDTAYPRVHVTTCPRVHDTAYPRHCVSTLPHVHVTACPRHRTTAIFTCYILIVWVSNHFNNA